MSENKAVIDTNLDILRILDSPQLPGLAPELIPFRDRALAIAKSLGTPQGCQSCAKAAAHRGLLAIAIELRTVLAGNPTLLGIVEILGTPAAQAKKEVQI